MFVSPTPILERSFLPESKTAGECGEKLMSMCLIADYYPKLTFWIVKSS